MQITDAQFSEVEKLTVLACGTSWHAALVGKYLIESLAQVPVEVDYGSEYRYRHPIVAKRSLAVVITQSGETADTLAALRQAKEGGALSVAICNVVGSMATRETDGTIYTHAGRRSAWPPQRRSPHSSWHSTCSRCTLARRAACYRQMRQSRTSMRCCSSRCCSSRR
jgi:glucosamine 6-phosphate synthetase-like amidotransferase/phosphosugar isomerase protein